MKPLDFASMDTSRPFVWNGLSTRSPIVRIVSRAFGHDCGPIGLNCRNWNHQIKVNIIL